MMNPRADVLLVIFDSLGARTLSRLIATLPTLCHFRKSSRCFDRANVCSPESGPARASLFTGLDMAAHRVWTDGVALPTREKTLAEVFSVNGYHTWLVGRRQLAGVSNWTTEHARLTEYDQLSWAHGPLHRSRQNAYLCWLKEAAPDHYHQIFPCQPNPDDTRIPASQRQAMAALPDELCFNSWVAQQFCTLVDERTDDTPFLAVTGFVVGEKMGAQASEKAIVEALDEHALLQADKALASMLACVPENTIVVVTAGRGNTTQGTAQRPMHDDAITVPLLIKSPSTQATVVNEAVSTIDIAPTLYTATQIRSPKRTQGRSLLTMPPRGWAFSRLRSTFMGHQSVVSSQRWKLVMHHATNNPGTDATVAPGSPAGTRHAAPPRYELYDLLEDPDETNDLATVDTHSSDLDNMIDLMIDARVALEDRTEPRIATF